MVSASDRAFQIISEKGGTVRTREALSCGIHPRTLYELRDTGVLEIVGRGVYRLANLPPLGDPDLVLIAKRVPRAVVCLISALSIHELTTQIPHTVHLALPRSARYPVVNEVPLTVYRFSSASYEAGIVEHDIGSAMIRIYNPEKTIADCFKYRNKLGIDLVIEALSAYRRQNNASMQKILEYAGINRVNTQIRPILEAIV